MSRLQQLLESSPAAPLVLPSLLRCDFANLQREVERLAEAGVRALHLDVMDGHFVPNFTYGMPIVAALRRVSDLPLDVHLMIERPERYLSAFVDAGADAVTAHVEAVADPGAVLRRIRSLGALAGLALNPATPLERVEPHLNDCDLLLVMSVNAGFGGQAFDPQALAKLRRARELAPRLTLSVDGGLNEQTIRPCAEAGARLFVVGSAIFGSADYRGAVRRLAERAQVS